MKSSEPERRSYHQFCGLARGLDVVGERWTLLIVRNLLLGPRRYSDLMAELPGITTNLLAKRLRDMEEGDLVQKEDLPPPASSTVYRLTDSGAALEPVVMELARWGGRFMDRPRPGDVVNVGWGLLSLKRRYAGGLEHVIEFVIGERAFELTFSPHYLGIQERAAARPAASAHMSADTFRALFWKGADAEALLKTKAITVAGSLAVLKECLAALRLH